MVNKRFKQLMKELGEAINGTLSDSDQIAEVVSRIKAEGYDIFLVLEATIGFNKRDEAGEEEPAMSNVVPIDSADGDPDFKLNAQDVKFLKSLRISMDDAA